MLLAFFRHSKESFYLTVVKKIPSKSQILFRFKKSMPPKKKGAEAEGPGPLLGRFGTSLKVGIVGLPNVG